MAQLETKAAIAALFYMGNLQKVEAKFFPYNFWSGFLSAPLILPYLLPLPCFCLIFGHYVIQHPQSIVQLSQKILNGNWQEILVFCSLLVLIVFLLVWSFQEGWNAFSEIILRGIPAFYWQTRTSQYCYGCLLTEKYFALRCLSHPFREPLILDRREITDFSLHSEYSETSHYRHYYVVLHYQHNLDQEIQRLRLPLSKIDEPLTPLYQQLKQWLNDPQSS